MNCIEKRADIGVWTFPGEAVRAELGTGALAELGSVGESFSRLPQDTQMADGGVYRFRRYSRFLLKRDRGSAPSFVLEERPGNSIFQSKEDNPLNGGLTRRYQALEQELMRGRFLSALIRRDARVLNDLEPSFFAQPVVVGVHQVRIVTRAGQIGKPTPEGIHRDAEAFTFQHFFARKNADGGEFRAYNENRDLELSWLQEDCLDSVLFCGHTWHSAGEISCVLTDQQGHRDIFLVDFEPFTPGALRSGD